MTNFGSPRNSEVCSLEQRGYFIGEKIGQGTHANVHLAEYISENGQKKIRMACKIFDKRKVPKDFLTTFFPRELEILTKIENPHIIQVHSILQRGPRVFIFMRYAENGDLLDYILKKGPIPEQQAKVWFRQMVSGLHYLHTLNIAHRDLKCENVLLSKNLHVKLADFGFARYCINQNGRRVLSETYCGSAAYAAPEVVASIPYNPKLADVWSLGVILFIMLNAGMPFDDENIQTLFKAQMMKNWDFEPAIRRNVSSVVKNMVKQLLEPDLTLRLTVDRILNHEWMRSKREKYAPDIGIVSNSASNNQNKMNAEGIGTSSQDTGPPGFNNIGSYLPRALRLGLKSYKCNSSRCEKSSEKA